MADDITRDFLNEVNVIEKNFKQLFVDVRSYLKQVQRSKKKSEKFILNLRNYASVETQEIKNSIVGLCTQMEGMDQAKQQLYDRVELKIFETLGNYHNHCKVAKDTVEKRDKITASKNSSKKSMEKAQKSNDQLKVNKFSFKYNTDAGSESRANAELYAQIESFERQKVQDIKAICTEYVHAEMNYHAKCLELLTQAFSFFDTLNEETEIKPWLKRIKPKQGNDNSKTDGEDTPIISKKSNAIRSSMSGSSANSDAMDSPYKTPKPNSTRTSGLRNSNTNYSGRPSSAMSQDSDTFQVSDVSDEEVPRKSNNNSRQPSRTQSRATSDDDFSDEDDYPALKKSFSSFGRNNNPKPFPSLQRSNPPVRRQYSSEVEVEQIVDSDDDY